MTRDKGPPLDQYRDWLREKLQTDTPQRREILVQHAAKKVWEGFQKDSWRKTPEYFQECLREYKDGGQDKRPYWMPPLLDLTPGEVDLVLKAAEALYE
jgi:hypothetical protein